MAGTWIRQRPHWWPYDILDQERPFADVVRHRDDGPKGALWDVRPSGSVAPLVERVTLAEAQAVVERTSREREAHGPSVHS